MEHKIELITGYKDGKGIVHKDIVFGHRLTAKDLMAIDADPRSNSRTQHHDMIRAKAMTKFGKLRMPPATEILVSLNKFDRADIARGYEEFAKKGREGVETEFRDGNTVLLNFGFEINGTRYRVAELNLVPTGLDEVAADTLGLDGLAREIFLIGRTISKLSTEDESPLTINGPIELSSFETLDGDDIFLLKRGAQLAEAFFASREARFKKRGMAKLVMVIARETGWSEKQILSLPKRRLNSYIEAMNEIYAKKT